MFQYEYSRSGNYSRYALEKCLAELDNGSAGFAFASGLAALNSLLQILETGNHIVAFDDLYGGSGRYFRKVASRFGLEFSYVDMRDPEATKNAIKPNTKMVFIETPSNPLMRLVDIAEVSRIAHEANPEILVVVDNTFLTPYFQVRILLFFTLFQFKLFMTVFLKFSDLLILELISLFHLSQSISMVNVTSRTK